MAKRQDGTQKGLDSGYGSFAGAQSGPDVIGCVIRVRFPKARYVVAVPLSPEGCNEC